MGDNPTDKNTKQPASDGSHSLLSELNSTSCKQTASDVGSSLAAGGAGAVAFSLLSDAGAWGKALSVPVAMAAGGMTKFATKAGIQEALLADRDRTYSSSDLIWGSVDGLAGVTASVADRTYSKSLLQSMGRRELGAGISSEMAETAGQQLVKDSALKAVIFNGKRGIVGGAAGSFTWSLPHRLYADADELKHNPLKGSLDVATGVVTDTAIGAAAGGIIGGGITGLHRSPEIIGRTVAKVQGDGGYLQLQEHALNDVHSNLDNLPRAMTKHTELAQAAAEQGIPTRFNIAGDQYAGHVNSAFTQGGAVENEALVKMGAENLIPGNHEYDAAGGAFDVERYPAMMAPILKENPQVTLLNANLDLSAYPNYADLTKPYVIHEVMGPNGPQRVATVGLITDEAAVGRIKYNDAAQTAIKTVTELNAMGIKNIMLLTHLGLEQDQKLAQTLLDNNLHVAKITGGHSHDVTARPVWVSNKNSLLDRLQFWRPEKSIPITQAGSGASWLSENNIVFNADGSANRWRTTGRLHPLDKVSGNEQLHSYIAGKTQELGPLKAITYDASVQAPFELNGMRSGENALGNLIAESNLSGLQKALPQEAPQIALVQAGSIKSGLAGSDVSRRDLANLFINAGKVEDEQKDLALASMTGNQIKAALEYGTHELPQVSKPDFVSRVGNIFNQTAQPQPDMPGNFLQVAGLKFDLDYSKPAWQRVSNLRIRTADGAFEPLADDEQYRVITRNHALQKWQSDGVFGNLSMPDLTAQLSAHPVPISQVDLLGDYISGREISPTADGAVDGRINDVTPRWGDVAAPPGRSLSGFTALAAWRNEQKRQ